MISKLRLLGLLVILVAAAGTNRFTQAAEQKDPPAVTVTGYVRDSGCVHRFH